MWAARRAGMYAASITTATTAGTMSKYVKTFPSFIGIDA